MLPIAPDLQAYSNISGLKDPDESKLGKHLASEGMKWIEPTHDTFRQLGEAAKAPDAAKKGEPAKKTATKAPSKAAPTKK